MSFLMWLFQTTLRSYITAPRTTRQISHKSFPSPSAEKKKIIIIGLFSKGGEVAHFSSEGMTNIYMQGQRRVRRQRLHYLSQGSCRDEVSVLLICCWPLPTAKASDGSSSSSRDWSCLNACVFSC